MNARLLGPLELELDHMPVPLGTPGRRALLARLLLDANRTVAIDRLVEDLWGHDAPATAAKMIQIHVSRLRKVLPAGTLVTRRPGYALQIRPEALDLVRFDRLRQQGGAALARGSAAEAAQVLRQALALWRGPALDEFDEPFAATAAPAHPRAVPLRPPGGGAGRLPRAPADAHDRARDRALARAARARAADAPAGPDARPEPASCDDGTQGLAPRRGAVTEARRVRDEQLRRGKVSQAFAKPPLGRSRSLLRRARPISSNQGSRRVHLRLPARPPCPARLCGVRHCALRAHHRRSLGTTGTVAVPGLAAGASTGPLSITLGPANNCFDPDCTIDVRADSGNAVFESNETNNTDTETFRG